MKLLETKEMFDEEIKGIYFRTTEFLNLSRFENLFYECGCGQDHRIDCLDGAEPLLAATSTLVLYRCPNGFVSFVRVKGFFTQEVITLFSGREKYIGTAEDLVAEILERQ
ncbi:MAG: hypothetical protein ISN29_00315 [Gammaproteobacteria bacterium AqS3]|nr:hypothetical protein [Gammaproteobacteria bacterium AqS3]